MFSCVGCSRCCSRDDLAVLAEAGHDAHDAVRAAVALLADAYRYAWDYGLFPRGTAPQLRLRVNGDAPGPRQRPRAKV